MNEAEVEEVRICGGCRWVKRPRRWTLDRLRRAAEAGLTPLLREVDALRRQRYWCSRENCWTHLLEEACSLWQPAEEQDAKGNSEGLRADFEECTCA